jgi:hypothetical protein
MSTLQDTDIIVVGRGNTPYKCTFLDWKNSQSKAPVIGGATLADSPEAGRFTSGTFATTVTMTEDGIPASTKGLKAWVEGTLKSAALSSAITGQTIPPQPTTWSMKTTNVALVPGGEGFTPLAWTDPSLHTISTSIAVGTSNNDEGQGGILLMRTDQPAATVTFSSTFSGAGDSRKIQFYSSADGSNWIKGPLYTLSDISSTGSHKTFSLPGNYIQFNIGMGWGKYYNLTGSSAGIRLTFADSTGLASFAIGDAVTEAGGGNDATGTVADVDIAGRAVTLASTAGTWDVGSQVKGPLKTAPGGASVKLYCKLDASLNVQDLQSADPGYTTVAGTGPYTLTWPATLPSGNPPDTDLPAGTQLTTEVQATNSSGTVTKASNTVTPA